MKRLRRGAPVGLVLGPLVVPPVWRPRQAGRLLRPLAEIEPAAATAPGPPVPAAWEAAAFAPGAKP